MAIQLGDFNTKVEERDTFKLTIRNERLHKDSNGNGVTTINFATSKNLVVKSTIRPQKTFISTPGPLPRGRLTTRLITY